MKSQPIESMPKGFCTFCMGLYDALRMGTHVRRCSARVDDASCVQTAGREHPPAFLLMIGIEGWPETWLCLEAHCQTLLSDLDHFIRHVWFPDSPNRGVFFFPQRTLEKRIGAKADLEEDYRLDQLLVVQDRFVFALMNGDSAVQVNVNVVGCLPTAIMHRPVDVVAFPLGSGGSKTQEPVTRRQKGTRQAETKARSILSTSNKEN
jgi:hypothetical protein